MSTLFPSIPMAVQLAAGNPEVLQARTAFPTEGARYKENPLKCISGFQSYRIFKRQHTKKPCCCLVWQKTPETGQL